ncbi:MAG: hypothetical protein MEP44_07385, partial [Blastomonas sp.]|nr:hypothetical protein [Blastomonas sp.]
MTEITVAALQLPLGASEAENIEAVTDLVAHAADKGADIILPPELFEGPYFCRVEDEALFASARPTAEHPSVRAMAKLARQLKVAIPTSFFERDGPHHYNSLAMIDPNGEIMGVYRKSHIPDGPGYEEKYYFRPGNTGFKVWDVCGTRIGVGICWDQWYPECARAMALMGAELGARMRCGRHGSRRCPACRHRDPCPACGRSRRTGTAPAWSQTRSSPTARGPAAATATAAAGPRS